MDNFSATRVATVGSDQTVYTGRGFLGGFTVLTDGTNAVIAELFDGASAGAKYLGECRVLGADRNAHVVLPGRGISFATSLVVKITGTGGVVIAYHRQGS